MVQRQLGSSRNYTRSDKDGYTNRWVHCKMTQGVIRKVISTDGFIVKLYKE